MENEKEKMNSLKAQAYDILVFIQNAQAELQRVNNQISELATSISKKQVLENVKEEKVVDEVK